ncbi:hypothetical protein GCM10025785_05320 [Corynebacterium canis]
MRTPVPMLTRQRQYPKETHAVTGTQLDIGHVARAINRIGYAEFCSERWDPFCLASTEYYLRKEDLVQSTNICWAQLLLRGYLQ